MGRSGCGILMPGKDGRPGPERRRLGTRRRASRRGDAGRMDHRARACVPCADPALDSRFVASHACGRSPTGSRDGRSPSSSIDPGLWAFGMGHSTGRLDPRYEVVQILGARRRRTGTVPGSVRACGSVRTADLRGRRPRPPDHRLRCRRRACFARGDATGAGEENWPGSTRWTWRDPARSTSRTPGTTAFRSGTVTDSSCREFGGSLLPGRGLHNPGTSSWAPTVWCTWRTSGVIESRSSIRPARRADHRTTWGGTGRAGRADPARAGSRWAPDVAELHNHRIQVLSSTGGSLRTFGRPGSAPGELSGPARSHHRCRRARLCSRSRQSPRFRRSRRRGEFVTVLARLGGGVRGSCATPRHSRSVPTVGSSSSTRATSASRSGAWSGPTAPELTAAVDRSGFRARD